MVEDPKYSAPCSGKLPTRIRHVERWPAMDGKIVETTFFANGKVQRKVKKPRKPYFTT